MGKQEFKEAVMQRGTEIYKVHGMERGRWKDTYLRRCASSSVPGQVSVFPRTGTAEGKD